MGIIPSGIQLKKGKKFVLTKGFTLLLCNSTDFSKLFSSVLIVALRYVKHMYIGIAEDRRLVEKNLLVRIHIDRHLADCSFFMFIVKT